MHLCRRSNEREKQTITLERERQNASLRTIETSLHGMELSERDLTNEIREKEALEERIEVMQKEIVNFTNKIKVIS